MGNSSSQLGRRFRVRFGAPHLVAVVAGLATALLLLSWTRSQEQLVSVVLAADDIRAGALIDADDFRPTEISANSTVVPALVSATDSALLVGQVAVRSITNGEPILRTDLRPVETEGGQRAMSFPLPPAHAVGGDLVVGDQVDVLVVAESGSRFVAEGVQVIGLPEEASTGLVGASAEWWVVLAVEDREALEIAAGVEYGTIYLLRSTGTPSLTMRELPPVETPDGDPLSAGASPGGG